MNGDTQAMSRDGLAPHTTAVEPAAYIHLVDSRRVNLSQSELLAWCCGCIVLIDNPERFPIWDREVFKIGRDPKSKFVKHLQNFFGYF